MSVMNCLKMLIPTVVGFCITLCILPVLLPMFFVFFILTMTVKLLVKIKYKDKASLATGSDLFYGTVGRKSYSVVNVAIRFVGQMNVPKLKSKLLNVFYETVNPEQQQRYRRMTQSYCSEYGYSLWKDYEEFDIDQHVKIINLNDIVKQNFYKEKYCHLGPVKSANVENLNNFLEHDKKFDWKVLTKILLNDLGSEPIKSEIPQWQIFFLEESNERYTMLFRFTHAMADGVYMTRMLCDDFLDISVDLFHNYTSPSRFKSSTGVKDVTTIIPVPRQNLNKSLKFKNKFAIISMKIPTPPKKNFTCKDSLNKGCSSLERLQMMKSVFEDAKSDPTIVAAQSFISVAYSLLPACVSEALLTLKGVTISFSNLPGPRSEIQYGNDLIEEIMFWSPDHDPLGNGWSVFSYNGKFRVGLCIDEAFLEDETEGDLLLQDFEDEIQNLSQEVDNQRCSMNDKNNKLESSKFLKQYS